MFIILTILASIGFAIVVITLTVVSILRYEDYIFPAFDQAIDWLDTHIPKKARNHD